MEETIMIGAMDLKCPKCEWESKVTIEQADIEDDVVIFDFACSCGACWEARYVRFRG